MNMLQRLQHRYGSSLRRRVRLGVGMAVLVVAVLMMVGVETFIYRTEQDVWSARQQDAAHNAARTVESFLANVQGDLTLVAALDTGELQAAPTLLNTLLGHNDALLEVVRLDAAGQVIASANQPDSTPVLANLFTLALSSWFSQAQNGETYLSAVQLAATNEPYLIMATPARNGEVVAARLRMTVLWDVVAGIHYGETGYAYVVDQDGYVIAHPDTGVVLSSTRVDDPDALPFLTEDFNDVWQGEYINFMDDGVLGSALEIVDHEWVVVTEIERHEANQTTVFALLVFGGGIAIAGGALFLISNQLMIIGILRPLEALRNGARRMGEGHLSERIDLGMRDEIGDLANEFNKMAGRLQQKIEETEMLATKANDANAFKSRLISRVSHELRNPLGGILGFTEMMQYGVYGDLDDQQQEALGRIMNSAHYLNKLVNELLEQSRLEGNRVGLTLTEFDPQVVIRNIVGISEPKAKSKGLALEVDVEDGLPAQVMNDQGKLEQVIANLVSNALKFTSAGAVRVRVFRPDEATWAFEVRDTGIGISPEAQEYIFEPFRQADESITREHEGFGLGLSIVKHLVALMNGDITLVSAVGQGSRFTVTLPVSIMQVQEAIWQSSAAD